MYELAQEFPEKSYRELEEYREEDRQQEAGTCIMGEMRKDREETFEPGPEEQIEVLKKEIKKDRPKESWIEGYNKHKKSYEKWKNERCPHN